MSTSTTDAPTRRVTLEDVALRVGVSKVTVSRVLGGKRKNSQHEEAILRAVRELNFEPDPVAQQLAHGGQSKVIGLFSGTPDLGVGTMVIWNIQAALLRNGLHAAFHSSGFNGSPGIDEVVDVSVLQALRRQRPQAIICFIAPQQKSAIEEIRRFQEDGGIVVGYGFNSIGAGLECDYVYFDAYDSAVKAAQYLLSQGHTDIGFCHHGHNFPENPRLLGLQAVLAEHGLEVRPEWIFYGDVYEANGALLARKFQELKERPTAIIVVNDVSAAAFVHMLMRDGLRVPGDVSVVGQDGIPASEYCVVPLTTVTQPVKAIADKVCELLVDRLDGNYTGSARRVAIHGELVERSSVAAISPTT